MLYNTGTIAINGNTATGTGTNWTAPASQVRAGQTIIVMSNPVQLFQISSVNSATSMTVTPAVSPALSGQKYGILVSDNISVDGLALAMSQLIKEYDENIGAWETFATTSANQNITVTINGTSLSIPALGKLLQKGSNGALPVNQGGTGATNAADARTNLGLGTAAQRNVGTGANQIPDMNSFTSQKSLTGWQKLPGGLILQWGLTTTSGSEQNALVTFPVAFPGSILMEYTTYANISGDPATGSTYIGQVRTTSNTQMYVRNLGPTNAQYNWLVIGY
ncbi:L-shaped tail fiber protein [Escherichia coli]|uniref:gp53-like domain-containing protein n=2 Tax=Enterobacteriaceae TaxID=543 RepID=UPI000DFED657|nr:hypothetical protein [Escherichia coli]STN57512.1 L-shaped tail fiber protein [Escherichia coli]